ncbi:hypothetical protein D0Z08_24255 [Nocardioides immobilis]|uniref:Uncharacterized protein n=1 Tax=Nocardioides immobilis TaxID=2049295 RepID=A0A417XVR0_9ACTN|nr:hypothetical protein [Nocardioides immobilis]RHW24436.1 hypothetical protein D0Z08_24255 [Nocardioides immobilis]
MRSIGTATLLIVLTVLSVLTGCGSDGGDADDVPTITTRPSTTASSSPTTDLPSVSATETSVSPPIASVTTPTAGSETPTETGPSPEPPTDQPVGPTTYREALQRVAAGAPGQVAARFSTDDDVIYCLLDDAVIGPACELRRGFIKDARICGGAAEGVGRIETFEGKARPVCPTDTIREPGAEVISDDGVVVTNGDGVDCLVETAGVTCVDINADTGFFLAPGEYHVF